MNIQGYFKRGLHIDCSRRTFEIQGLEDPLLEQTLGGKGLGAQLLLERIQEGVDPLSEQNRLLFVLGPATDSLIWGSSRWGVVTISPLTGGFSESYAGGRGAIPMSRTGFDCIDISGACDRPVWLEVGEQGAKFHSAEDLWGMDCHQAEAALRDRVDALAGVAVIGPAGENLVRFAVLATDRWHMAGRGGIGAVLGSKKIKGIVFHGRARRPVARPEAIRTWSKKLIQKQKHASGTETYRRFGTPAMVDLMNTAGAFPSAYWSTGRMQDWEKINSEGIAAAHHIKATSCPRCFLDCRNLVRVKNGRHQGLRIEGPEYETLYAFGGLCLVSDVREITYLNDLCDRLGMDTMSCGNLVGLALEAAKQGRIQADLEYGRVDQIERLVLDISARKGLGGVLALGIREAAAQLGLEDLAVHVKGMEPAGYDPRVLKGMGLAYAVSARGACHLRASFHRAELTGLADAADPRGLVASFLEHEDLCTLMDCLILCRFFRKIYGQAMPEIVAMTTGLELDMPSLRALAARITDITRLINLRQGFSARDDRLPGRLVRQALPDGSRITQEEMDVLVSEYYQQRGWDAQGIPRDTRIVLHDVDQIGVG